MKLFYFGNDNSQPRPIIKRAANAHGNDDGRTECYRAAVVKDLSLTNEIGRALKWPSFLLRIAREFAAVPSHVGEPILILQLPFNQKCFRLFFLLLCSRKWKWKIQKKCGSETNKMSYFFLYD